jgi:hypothetical protein
MILGILISDLASSLFSKLQLWRPVVSVLTKAIDYDLRFVGQIRSQNDPVILSPTILGPTLEKISEQYSAFRTELSGPSVSGGPPLRPIANGYLTFGFPRYLPDPKKTVFSICDLNHWMRPDGYSEADRLEAQASILGAMRDARGFLFWSADLLNEFERVFPHWLAEESKPYRLINVPSGIEAHSNKLRAGAYTSAGSQSGAIEGSSDFCSQNTTSDLARALKEFCRDLGLT